MLRVVDGARVLELGLLSSEAVLDVRVIAVLELAVLNTGHVVRVLFWENLTVMDRLDGGVMVVLVNLTVDRLGDILVTGVVDMLFLDGRVHSLQPVRRDQQGGEGTYLVDGGIMLSILGEETSNCGLCFIHYG